MTRKRILTFLWVSLICLAALCVAVFGTITRVMVERSDQTLTQVANLYMEEINGQLQRHFDSLVEMQLAQVEGITLAVPPARVDTIDEAVIRSMSTAARARDFEYLALYNTEGKADVLYGEPVTIREEDEFLASLNRGDPKVVMADTADGEGLLLFGVSVGYPLSEGYPMPDGSQCTALLAGVPLDTINDTLSLSIDNTLIYSHIIETNGRFVL